MTSRHPATRARDRDRDASIEVIEGAYADGQISDADRELRVGRALQADTLADLLLLTADLQPEPGSEVVVAGPKGSASRTPVGRVVAIAAGVVVVVGVITTGLVVASVNDDSDVVVDDAHDLVQPVRDGSAPVAGAPAVGEPFDQSRPAIETFVDRYEQQFSTSDVYDFSMHPEFVMVTVPSRGSRPRSEIWYYRDGAFEASTVGARAVRDDQHVFDLRDVDVAAMLRTVERGRRVFEVPRAPWYAIARDDFSGSELLVYTVNEYSEGGYIATTYAGKEIRRVPFS